MKPAEAACGALLIAASCAWAQAPIRLKARTIQPARVEKRLPAASGGRRSHYVLQFANYPGADTRRELMRRRIRILGYVPDSGLMVSSGADVDLTGLDVSWSGSLAAGDKLSPLLESETAPAFLVVFHGDVDMDIARGLALQRGFSILENPAILPHQLVIGGDPSRLEELAACDEVSYILPASADLASGKAVTGCSGALTEAGLVGEYAVVGRGWAADPAGGVALKYYIESVSASLDSASARSEVERAFREWARYANVTFSEGARAAAARTLAIRFAHRVHGDAYSFDGSGGTLAHAFYPAPPNAEPIAGDMHFDADEPWRVGADLDLFSVALHEAGHALGLGHSDNAGSVMYPYYRLSTGLSADDITGVQKLYGSAGTQPGTPPPSGPDPPVVTPPEPPAPTPRDNTSPSIRIVSPVLTIVSTNAASIKITGRASDNVGVTAVKWTTSTGLGGPASGTANWTAIIPLLVGTNVVKILAYDLAGNSAWRSVTVVRR